MRQQEPTQDHRKGVLKLPDDEKEDQADSGPDRDNPITQESRRHPGKKQQRDRPKKN